MKTGCHALRLAVALSAMLAGSHAAAEGQVIVATGGGLFERGLAENIGAACTAESGIEVVWVAASPGERAARVAAMSKTGRFEWDILLSSETHARQLNEHLPQDVCGIAGIESVLVGGGCRSFGSLGVIGGLPPVHRSDMFDGRLMESRADFLDLEAFPGPRGLPTCGNPMVAIVPALLADGLAECDLCPIDFDRAFAVLDRIKASTDVWWRSGDQSRQIFRSDEAIAGQLWSGRG
jgi:spermidine/putrescine-binding protein